MAVRKAFLKKKVIQTIKKKFLILSFLRVRVRGW